MCEKNNAGMTNTPHLHSEHGRGLSHDLQTLITTAPDRRSVLRWLTVGTAATLPLMGCGGGDGSAATSSATTTSSDTTTTSSGSGSCTVIPSETAGPYPGDGSNSNGSGIANALTLSGIVRSDIRSSIVGSSSIAQGAPLTVTLKLVNTNASCALLSGYAIYLWHCTRDGGYSMYSSGITAENFLRGVQVTDSKGEVTFTTIFPGCYATDLATRTTRRLQGGVCDQRLQRQRQQFCRHCTDQ